MLLKSAPAVTSVTNVAPSWKRAPRRTPVWRSLRSMGAAICFPSSMRASEETALMWVYHRLRLPFHFAAATRFPDSVHICPKGRSRWFRKTTQALFDKTEKYRFFTFFIFVFGLFGALREDDVRWWKYVSWGFRCRGNEWSGCRSMIFSLNTSFRNFDLHKRGFYANRALVRSCCIWAPSFSKNSRNFT